MRGVDPVRSDRELASSWVCPEVLRQEGSAEEVTAEFAWEFMDFVWVQAILGGVGFLLERSDISWGYSQAWGHLDLVAL